MSVLLGKACVSTMCSFLKTHVIGPSFMFSKYLDFILYSSSKLKVLFHFLPIIILVDLIFLLCLKNFLYFLGINKSFYQRKIYIVA